MFSRPVKGESEEDLLRIQREFLNEGKNPAASVKHSTQNAGAPGLSDELDPMCEKRPRDVVSLQGNESFEVLSNIPRKKSKFKDQHQQKCKQVELDGAELLENDDPHVSIILSKILERETKSAHITMPNITPKGFPIVLHRNAVNGSLEDQKSNSTKSLFARQFAKSKAEDFGIEKELKPPHGYGNWSMEKDKIKTDEASYSMSSLISGEGLTSGEGKSLEHQKIHDENVKKLSSMSESEILQEQAELREMIDPSIVEFLTQKQKKSKEETNNSIIVEQCDDNDVDEGFDSYFVEESHDGNNRGPSLIPGSNDGSMDVANNVLGSNISEKWLHMDHVEHDKLEWMKKIPNARTSRSNEQARFDFQGNIMTKTEGSIPEYLGLHHHGQEPDRPGYTLEELFILSRSNLLNQRVVAVNILTKVIQKDRRGIYINLLEQDLLPVLLNAGLPFLLRWTLDDNADQLIAASVACFTALLVRKRDEFVADMSCFTCYRGKEIPSLCPMELPVKEDGTSNLPDVDVVKQDLIKGLIQMRFLPRLRYILEVCRPASPVVLDILDILIRISRHSLESAHNVATCPRLLETIMLHFLPSSWKQQEESQAIHNVYGYPLVKALKLLRVLCCAGKYLTDTLVTKFGLISRILRFITVPAHEMMLTLTEAYELTTESFTIWTICISYGLACESFSNVYSHIVTQVQNIALYPVCSTSQVRVACALVDLIEAVTHVAGSKAELQAQLSTHFATGGMDASHLPPPPIDWSHVLGLLPLIGHGIRQFKDSFVSAEVKVAQNESFLLLAKYLNLLASFYEKLVVQPFYSPVESLQEIENFVISEICQPMLDCKTFETLLSRLTDYTSYYASSASTNKQPLVTSLPDFKCSLSDDLPRCLRDGSPFPLLLSFSRLAMIITSCHKGVAKKFQCFLKNDCVVKYLKSCTTPRHGNTESQCVFVKVEQHFQYFLFKLFYNVFIQVGNMDGELTALYHTSSLLLFSRLFSGDEFYAHDLMSVMLFNSALFHESRDEHATTITSDFSEMGIKPSLNDITSPKETTLSRGELLSEAYKDLLPIRSTFISSFAQMRHALAKSRACSLHQPQNITSFLLPPSDGTMLPADWMFLPLVDLHNITVKEELLLKSQPDRQGNASKSIVKRTLQWVLLLEEWRPVVLHQVLCTAKIARLMCTFLTGSDLFLDTSIHKYLKSLLHSYTHTSQLSSIDFDTPIPGISSFYDLYVSFVIQYQSVSYGDHLFSAFLLLPLQQRYNKVYRMFIWNENADIFRSFSLPLHQLPVPLENFLFPAETNVEILFLKLRAFTSGFLRLSWSPIFYLIAIHHLSMFCFSRPESIHDLKQRLKIMNQVLLLPDQDVRNDIISYQKPFSPSAKGFLTFKTLPPTREILLRNKHDLSEAWGVWNQVTESYNESG